MVGYRPVEQLQQRVRKPTGARRCFLGLLSWSVASSAVPSCFPDSSCRTSSSCTLGSIGVVVGSGGTTADRVRAGAVSIMALWCAVVLLIAGVSSPSWRVLAATAPEEEFQNILKLVTKSCKLQFSSGCLQMQVLTTVDRLFTEGTYELFPGMYLSQKNIYMASLPQGLRDRSALDLSDPQTSAQAVNRVLSDRLLEQLRTWSLTVNVFGNNTLQQLRSLMDVYLSEGTQVEEGRKFKWYRYVGTVLLTAAFSIISALVSKALTLGLLALILTLMGRGGAGFGFSNLSSSPHAAAVPVPAYRTPLYAPLPLRAQLTSAAEMQYMDETDDLTNPYVYVNRKSLKAARSDGFGKYSSRY